MMTVEDKRLFHKHEPTVSDQDIKDAGDSARLVVSFKGKPVIEPPTKIGLIAVKFVLANGASETILLNEFVARLLHTLIESSNKLNWDGASLKAKDGPAH